MRFFVNILIILLIYSCEPIEYNSPKYYHQYFPIELNTSKEYLVTSISHTSFGKDTNIYFLKEIISEIQLDNQGDTSFRIERFTKSDSLEEFIIKDVWTIKKSHRSIEISEENERFVKMVFPINEYLYWNGNALNSRDAQEYYIENLHESYNLNNYTFDSTMTVIQNFKSNQIEYESAKEVYANEIGLIYKENIILNITSGNISDVNYGTSYVQELINY